MHTYAHNSASGTGNERSGPGRAGARRSCRATVPFRGDCDSAALDRLPLRAPTQGPLLWPLGWGERGRRVAVVPRRARAIPLLYPRAERTASRWVKPRGALSPYLGAVVEGVTTSMTLARPSLWRRARGTPRRVGTGYHSPARRAGSAVNDPPNGPLTSFQLERSLSGAQAHQCSGERLVEIGVGGVGVERQLDHSALGPLGDQAEQAGPTRAVDCPDPWFAGRSRRRLASRSGAHGSGRSTIPTPVIR